MPRSHAVYGEVYQQQPEIQAMRGLAREEPVRAARG